MVWHAEKEMPESQTVGEGGALLVLGVDTCGASGTVALARIDFSIPPLLRKDGAPEAMRAIEILGQTELAGRTYSATLVSAVEGLLTGQGVGLADVGAIVVVHGPGSFTGVRVGLSAVKGLAEPVRIPVVAVSRLAVLAAKAGVGSAALDAHRREVFLRLGERELLAGAEELVQVSESRLFDELRAEAPGGGKDSAAGAEAPHSLSDTHGPAEAVPLLQSEDQSLSAVGPVGMLPEGPHRFASIGTLAVCEEAAESLLKEAWPGANLTRSEAPTAADAIELCVPRILAGESADLGLLDGHYLRRSDAEIFGDAAKSAVEQESRFTVRRMVAGDVERVVDLAARTQHAPGWQRQAYEKAVDPEARPQRIALVAEERSTGDLVGYVVASVTAPEAELESIVTAAAHQRRGVARELLARLKAELGKQGVHEVMLEVRAGNHGAQGFYRFVGFAEQGRRPGYYSDPVEDAVLMKSSF